MAKSFSCARREKDETTHRTIGKTSTFVHEDIQDDIRARRLTIAGIYQTNFSEYNNLFLLTDLNLVNRLNGWQPEQVTGVELHANNILVMLYYYLLRYKGWRGPAVRNLATTHVLDKVAESFGQKCYEVPVGFKHISAKMQETDAIIGGESSGGLTVKGHIHGKDGIYAAALLVEMIAVSGKRLSEIAADTSL